MVLNNFIYKGFNTLAKTGVRICDNYNCFGCFNETQLKYKKCPKYHNMTNLMNLDGNMPEELLKEIENNLIIYYLLSNNVIVILNIDEKDIISNSLPNDHLSMYNKIDILYNTALDYYKELYEYLQYLPSLLLYNNAIYHVET